ncbi:WecB/TagA/CpsF family glycosyltransferase [uncultured Pedobacter sp.]|uniref:WecB/TagA/CpsF family glycosyltransferase n=1 Tax=uncultured Pedobacter sp. TaxID=246139 RepID=UPI0025D029CD|nr:WecB/TagA/CpsF family glycosyltransferase [uncultured Pedobacter sp.]
MLNKVDFLGYDFISAEHVDIVAQHIIRALDQTSDLKYPVIFTPNVDYLVKLNRPENFYLNEKLVKSEYILPDGQPIIWAAKLKGKNLRHRLAGSDLFLSLFTLTTQNKIATLYLTSGIKVSNYFEVNDAYCKTYTLPFFDQNDNVALDKIVSDTARLIIDHEIKIVYIGVSFPKQDVLGFRILDELKKQGIKKLPTVAFLGASLEFKAGLKKRAPEFFKKAGLEWFYRFVNEPTRLFKRYFIDSFGFFKVLIQQGKK